MNRAYSILTVKAVDDDERVIRGVATTPTPDRVGDIVEPLGVKFKNPMPLLWQHRADQPVGHVTFDAPTEKGVTFEARLPKIAEPGRLKDRVDEAWQSVKARLVTAVSIGFRIVEHSVMETGGWRINESEVLELSLVTIPANSEATISLVKSIDADLLAASGRGQDGETAPRKAPPAAAGSKRKSIKLGQEARKMSKKTISEHIAALEAERASKHARMEEILQKSMDEGRSTEEDEQEEFDGLESDISAIDADLKRYRAVEKASAASAKAVDGVRTTQAAADARSGRAAVQIKRHEDLLPGIAFARYAKVKALSHLEHEPARVIAKNLYGEDSAVYGVFQKAAVAAGSSGGDTWGDFLVGDETSVFADFVEYLRPQTIIGRFGQNGVPSLRTVPFRTALISATSGASAAWVGEGGAKPLTSADGTRTTLDELKIAAIAVVTDELLRKSSPAADMWLRDELAAAVINRMDADFIDPTNSGTSNVKPASIVNGVSAVGNASGTTADDVRADLVSLITAYSDANNPLQSGVLIMRQSTAINVSMMRNSLGQQEFPALGRNGGTLEGFPVLTTNHVGTDSAGAYVVMVNASDIWLGDEGGVMVDMSREASLEMADNPTGTAITPTAASLVSMWQTNSVAFRAERIINWARRRTEAVQWLDAVAYAA